MFNESRNPMHRKKKFLLIPVMILLFFALSAAVQFLWNSVLPEAMHVSPLSYWHAAGLLLLCRILFGNFGFKGRGGDRHFGGPTREMREKWMGMSDEERAKFKQRFRDRCGNRR
ncbi:MAG: hypothetical protein ABIN91_24825 [Mucilaginibacter sp.]|uniref:hypothetical protein n=1 Tax=Mucilaginibacter sp. TaxID=1882438 RepID=UPI0032661D51